MKRISVGVLLVLMLAGCKPGYGHHHHSHHHKPPPPPPGTLEVVNDFFSNASVIRIEAQEQHSHRVTSRDVVVPPGTGAFFDLPPGPYDVTVIWENGNRDRFFDIWIKSHKTTTLNVRF